MVGHEVRGAGVVMNPMEPVVDFVGWFLGSVVNALQHVVANGIMNM